MNAGATWSNIGVESRGLPETCPNDDPERASTDAQKHML
jgi:hypothetical protein